MPHATKEAKSQVKVQKDKNNQARRSTEKPRAPKTNRRMQGILPPLPSEAKQALKAKIQADGPTEPLYLWSKDGTLLDGYARLSAYEELGIKDYPIVEVDLESVGDARLWRFAHNVSGRRHLNVYLRVKAALAFLDYFKKKAKANQRLGGKGMKVVEGEKIHALDEVARIAGVSRDTVNKVRCIHKWITSLPANRRSEIFNALEAGSKTINSAYSDTKRASRITAKKKTQANHSGAEFKNPPEAENAILCCDVIRGLKRIDDGAATLVFTSPPYHSVATTYGGVYEEKKTYQDYLDWLKQVWAECARILRPGGRLVINIDATRNREDESSYAYPIYADLVNMITDEEIGLLWKDDIVWLKQNISGKKSAMGSRECPCIRRNHEYLLCFSKDTFGLPYAEGIPSDLTDDEFKLYTISTWEINPASKKNNKHPHPFPNELAKRVIKLFCYPGDWVVDPFLGSGTVTAMAAKLGRRYTGIDLNPDYCRAAKKRTKAALAEISQTKDAKAEAA